MNFKSFFDCASSVVNNDQLYLSSFLIEACNELNEKLTLLKAVQIVLKNALDLIGVNAVDKM